MASGPSSWAWDRVWSPSWSAVTTDSASASHGSDLPAHVQELTVEFNN